MMATSPTWLLVTAVLLALVPIVAGVATSYLKVSIVLSLLRNALGAQQVPSNLVIMTVATALTWIIMSPVFESSITELAKIPAHFFDEAPSLTHFAALKPALTPWRKFMEKHSGVRERKVLERTLPSDGNAVAAAGKESPFSVTAAAFVITELKQAFAMGFVLLLPFLVIDLIVANVLMGMGMSMVSPVMVSLPLKLLLFVLSDGWLLLCRGLIDSYQ